ncbi:hypothetical protein PHYBOEH_002027 [Phytophthora boehmeriae]|uniref:Transmembrane protein n=1 Tax=Phytophthora boehmeriae TaxID=109152 RepID=A0A8T1WRT3_9STRA|nr:hypothetical protein PHYBOEH_002027 [Phytophthora boehmeriae]
MVFAEQFEVMRTLRSEFANRGYGRRAWMMTATPAEKEVFMKYRRQAHLRGAAGGLVGTSAMAAVWKMAALSTGLGVTGVLVGGVIGAGLSVHTSNLRKMILTDMLMLSSDESPRAAEAREILQTKLPNNAFVQELMMNPAFAVDSSTEVKEAAESFKDK